MGFRGMVLSVDELLRESVTSAAVPVFAPAVGVLHTAAGNAARAAVLLREGEPAESVWRFGVLQTLDDYTSTVRRGGPSVAAGVFADAPDATGSVEIDAAFAALAEHLATRDGWPVPAWAFEPSRRVRGRWFAATPNLFRAEAEAESPEAFRTRGIFITPRALARA